ncbi:hypothetical protein F4859DRAFT_515210 [Xylaria cf. heliscus]|nr:hypothetical protein F4859DRAFT_515210 [Xylaria cf. heliscus]
MSTAVPNLSTTLNSGQFDWLGKLGATREAIATLNDQPYVFYVLVAALVLLILEGVFIWYIHIATMKPEQKKKKEKKDEKKPGRQSKSKCAGLQVCTGVELRIADSLRRVASILVLRMVVVGDS